MVCRQAGLSFKQLVTTGTSIVPSMKGILDNFSLAALQRLTLTLILYLPAHEMLPVAPDGDTHPLHLIGHKQPVFCDRPHSWDCAGPCTS